MIKDRNGNILSGDEKQDNFLSFLYKNRFGRIIMRVFCRRWISNLGRIYMTSSLSKPRIKRLIAQNGIDMSQYEQREFSSFNDFFTRKIVDGAREIDFSSDAVIAPADSKLTVYDISEDSIYHVKGCDYSIVNMLGGDKELASEFIGGKAFVYRLTVDNYHRYCHVDGGKELYYRFIPGVLHTVNPIAVERHDVYGKNCRELTVMETENFGKIAYIEIGAMMVGRINNTHEETFSRGEEKGFFSFGGSTIILLYKKGVLETDADILANSAKETETAVKYGEKVGRKI